MAASNPGRVRSGGKTKQWIKINFLCKHAAGVERELRIEKRGREALRRTLIPRPLTFLLPEEEAKSKSSSHYSHKLCDLLSPLK